MRRDNLQGLYKTARVLATKTAPTSFVNFSLPFSCEEELVAMDLLEAHLLRKLASYPTTWEVIFIAKCQVFK